MRRSVDDEDGGNSKDVEEEKVESFSFSDIEDDDEDFDFLNPGVNSKMEKVETKSIPPYPKDIELKLSGDDSQMKTRKEWLHWALNDLMNTELKTMSKTYGDENESVNRLLHSCWNEMSKMLPEIEASFTKEDVDLDKGKLKTNPKNLELLNQEKKLLNLAQSLEVEMKQWDTVLETRNANFEDEGMEKKRKFEEIENVFEKTTDNLSDEAQSILDKINERLSTAPNVLKLHTNMIRQKLKRVEGFELANEHARTKLVNAFQASAFSGYENIDKPQNLIKSLAGVKA